MASLAMPKAKRSKTVMVVEVKTGDGATMRKSARHKGDSAATAALEKTHKRAAEKNLDAGTSFAPLSLVPDSHLSDDLDDCCAVFVSGKGTWTEWLSLLRAKEKVQAALAEAAHVREHAEAARTAREAYTVTAGGGRMVVGRRRCHRNGQRNTGH
jgi:hypothetical protein